MAAAVVALAERYQRDGQMGMLRWGAAFLAISGLTLAILNTIERDLLGALIWGSTTLVWAGHLLLNPATRPKMVDRSLQASRQVIATGS